MSVIFKSPMPKKFQGFFFLWVLCAMFCFAMVGISMGSMSYWRALVFLIAALLLVGFGFMIRKRVLRSMGMVKGADSL